MQFNKTMQKGFPDFELQIKNGKANIQDFLNAINDFIEIGALPRRWPSNCSSCYGCDLCCHEPLPVTSIDIENFCRTLKIDFMASFKYLWVEVQGNVVDITLRRKKGQDCIFLHQDGTCKIYRARPFLCQSYICSNTPESINKIRSEIVNPGMDELVRKAIVTYKSHGKTIPVNRGSARYISLTDWPRNCFSDKKSYSEILLKNVLSSDLMRVLLL
ncbi:MAG: YkgJ family cysteine cluster protein [Syntrophomonas sp.]